eukprot:scaffold5376_cov171-Amphora_coffeaeformis.AAC.6
MTGGWRGGGVRSRSASKSGAATKHVEKKQKKKGSCHSSFGGWMYFSTRSRVFAVFSMYLAGAGGIGK